MPAEYFFDTYALVALATGEPAYSPYRGLPVVCERYNLLELAYKTHMAGGPDRARRALKRVHAKLLEPRRDQLLRAAALKASPEGKGLSYVDALGYVLAGEHGLRFLTGDRAFRDLPNVEFVPVARRPRRGA